MGKVSRGKEFEEIIKDCLLKLNTEEKIVDVQRLYDTTNGFSGIKQPADFVTYKYPFCYYLECKATHKHVLNKSYITQLDDLKKKAECGGIIAGVFIWYVDDDLTIFVPVETLLNHFYNRDKKSVAVKEVLSGDLDKSGEFYILQGHKKRIFYDYDMEDFFDWCEGYKGV